VIRSTPPKRSPSSEATTPDGETPLVDWLRRFRSAEALYVSDGRQRIVAWSPEAEALFGRSAAEVLGRPCYEVMAGREPGGHPVCRRNCRVVTNARRGRPTASYEIVARRGDGEAVTVRSTIILAPPGSGGTPFLLHLVHPGEAAPVSARGSERLRHRLTEGDVPPLPQPLSRRELEVLRLLASGRTTVEIADLLGISRFTARNHIAAVQRKLGARSRVEAVVLAAHHHLL
jgi:PAS domain S-box-containing protein